MGMSRPQPPELSSSTEDQAVEGRPQLGEGDPLSHRWWLWPLAAFILIRLADAVMIAIASQHAEGGVNPLTGAPLDDSYGGATAPPGYLTTATNWDGQWYWQIADKGYPTELPRDASGDVRQNVWAFFPLYPMTVRLIMAVTGLGFPLAAVMVSLVAGSVATLLLYRLVAPVTDRLGARLLVVILNTFVCAPVFQIAYTEGMALALLVATLLAFQRRRTGLTAVLVLLLALTRAVVLPLAAVLAISAVVGWRRGARRKELIQTLTLATWAMATTFLWPAIAALTTGEPKAYLLTQAAWNPEVARLPVLRFIDRTSAEVGGPWVGIVLVALSTMGVVWALTVGQRHGLLRLWSGTYALYLLSAVDWNPTAIRYFLLAIPAVWAPTDPSTGWPSRHRAWIAGAVGLVGLTTQWWWIRYSLTISPEFYQLP
jgi:hypothetical protein